MKLLIDQSINEI